jgi:type I restriction enzyme, S subunit
MSQLLKGWRTVRIHDVCEVNPREPSPSDPSLPISFVPMPAVSDTEGTVGEHSVRRFSEVAKGYTRFRERDVIFAKITPCMENGKIAIAENLHNGLACGSTEFHVLRCSNNILPEYLWRYLRQLSFREEAERHMAGAVGQQRVPAQYLKDAAIPLPPLDEQRRIVAKLDALFARSRRGRAELERVPKLVERAKQAVLAKAFAGELTREWRLNQSDIETAAALIARTPVPVQPRGGREAAERVIPGIAALSVNDPGTQAPDGWKWVSLHRIARQETGHTPSRSHPEWWDGDIRWIGIKDAGVYHGGVINDTFQKTNAAGLANSAARLLPTGTVCLSRTASVGYVVIMGRDMATSQDFVTWTCSEALQPKYLMYALMAEGDEIRRFGKGSTHTTIYFPEVRALHICLAPLAEQAEIVRRIEAAFARIDRMAAEADRATALLDRLEQATLAKAFRGELFGSN